MDISKAVNTTYYILKPIIPRRLQIELRRRVVSRKRRRYSHVWPILEKAGKSPKGWPGWPERKQFALVLTHDVDTFRGHERCYDLMKLEVELGFRSEFNFVPERYNVSSKLRDYLVESGFEVGVHGLNHDGKLFRSRKIFNERSDKINYYLKAWNAVGFRSPAMHHNLEWIHDLNIKYDMSTFDVDPFEPQSDGVNTIFPFQVSNGSNGAGYVELPYTLPQDFTLFILMQELDITIWKQKLDWIASHGGMALLNTHPDYMRFSTDKMEEEVYSVDLYKEFLEHIRRRYEGLYWHVRPCEMADYISKHLPPVTTN